MGVDQPVTGLTPCRWCGADHGPLCPHVKALEFDPETGNVVRVEFLTPIDYYPQKPAAPAQDSYPKLPGTI